MFRLCIYHSRFERHKVLVEGEHCRRRISSVDDPCTYLYFSVYAADQVIKEGAASTETKELTFYVFGFDNCQALNYSSFVAIPLTVSLTNASNVTLPFDFLVDVTPFDSYDVIAQKRLVGSVTLTATGDSQKSRQDDITQSDTTRQVVRSRGTTRDATISATAKFDGAQLNFSAETGSAEMGTTRIGTMEITRY